jgi:hypothetical protein
VAWRPSRIEVIRMLLSDHSNLVDSCRDRAVKIHIDPRAELDLVNMEISVRKAQLSKIQSEIDGLEKVRRDLIRIILE